LATVRVTDRQLPVVNTLVDQLVTNRSVFIAAAVRLHLV